MYHILRNLLDGHDFGINGSTVTSLNEGVGNGNHLLVVLVGRPGGNGVVDEVTVDKLVIGNRAVSQAVVAVSVLHVQVETRLVDGGQRSGEVTNRTLILCIQFFDASNIHRRLLEVDAKNALEPWDPATDDIGTKIQTAWMQRVHEIVDYVIGQGMYCILNIHHDTGNDNTAWIVADEANYTKQRERFEAVWKQIAEEFKDYDEHLLFEGYNEMTDVAKSWCFASFGASGGYNASIATSAYNAINSYAQSFVNTVRSTGGKNAQRNLIVSTYAACCGEGSWNAHLLDPLKQMKKPAGETDHVIFEVHSYPSIKNSLASAKTSVTNMMSSLQTLLASKGAPVIIGEWGTANDIQSNTDDYDVRRADKVSFARHFVEQAKAKGIATFYWMGLSDGDHRSVPEFNQSELVDAIIKGYYGEQGNTQVSTPVSSGLQPQTYYDLQGRKQQTLRHGINIVRASDGSVRKVLK